MTMRVSYWQQAIVHIQIFELYEYAQALDSSIKYIYSGAYNMLGPLMFLVNDPSPLQSID